MTRVVTLEGFIPGERNDGQPWTQARFEEAATFDGPFTALQTIDLASGPGVFPVGLDPDPKQPQSRAFTTTLAALDQGFYRIVFIDGQAHEQATGAVFDGPTTDYTSPGAVRRVLSPDGSQDPLQGSAAALSDEELEDAIGDAVDEVNGRIGGRYNLPIEGAIPALLQAITRDIAAYLATLTYRRGDPIDANDPVQKRYDRAQDLLAGIAKGTVELPVVPTGVPEGGVENAVVQTNGYDGDLFNLRDFSLAPGPYRYPGIMPPAPLDWPDW